MSPVDFPNSCLSWRAWGLGISCSLLCAARTFAQPMTLSWQTLGEGGGAVSSQAYQLTATIGQANAASVMTNRSFSLTGGFWVDLEGATIVSVISSPSNRLCCPGSSPTLTVVADGTPPLAFQWRRNGADLVDGPGISGATSSHLTLLAISPEGGGSFDVKVKNAYGNVTSSPVQLVVTSKPSFAVPMVVNGSIVGATVLDGGCGYANAPRISFTDVGGKGALAYATILNGSVTDIQMVSGGTGYSTNTLLAIEPPVYPRLTIALGPSNGLQLEAADLMAGQTYQLRAATNDFSHWAGLGDFIAADTTWQFTNDWSISATNQSFFQLQWSQ